MLQNRRFVFRTYAVIVGGLLLIAAAFDYGLARLQGPGSVVAPEWPASVLTLIEGRLASEPEDEWGGVAESLQRELGYPVRIFPLDHIVQTGEPADDTLEVFDAAGQSSFLRRSSTIDAGIQIGPVGPAPSDEAVWVGLIPPLFYASIVVIVGFWIRPLLRDVNVLTSAARGLAADHRKPVTTRDRTTTLNELAATFDEMSERIRTLIQSQKEIVSALSHEVRTPLARIRFAMAVMEGKGSVADELESIDQDVREIDRLIGTMLDYARLDYDGSQAALKEMPVAEWLDRIVRKSLAARPDLRVDIDVRTERAVMDPKMMALALSNLLVNACRYAVDRVSVSLSVDGDNYLLAVDDDGPGIPETERESVFEPFKRMDDSRSRTTGGYGLGLAIVARIAARHAGAARAERSPLGGGRLVIAWPIA